MARIRFYYHQGYNQEQKSDLSEKVNNQQETGSTRALLCLSARQNVTSDGGCPTIDIPNKLAILPPLSTHLIKRVRSLNIKKKTKNNDLEVRCFVCYLTDRSHSTPAYFEDGFPKFPKNLGLVPPLGTALAVRKIAGATGGNLRSKPVTLFPGTAAGIRRLEHVFRIAVAFIAVD